MANKANAEVIMCIISTHLVPYEHLIHARDVDGLKATIDTAEYPLLTHAVELLVDADLEPEVPDKIWRYLELFCKLCNFSECE